MFIVQSFLSILSLSFLFFYFNILGLSLIFGGFIELCNVCFKTNFYKKPVIEEMEISIKDDDIIS